MTHSAFSPQQHLFINATRAVQPAFSVPTDINWLAPVASFGIGFVPGTALFTLAPNRPYFLSALIWSSVSPNVTNTALWVDAANVAIPGFTSPVNILFAAGSHHYEITAAFTPLVSTQVKLRFTAASATVLDAACSVSIKTMDL